MIQLLEKEFGYDAEVVGFPSILGCHGVLYLTEEGLYGFHNAGGSKTTDFPVRAKWLADFAKENFVAAKKGIHLYGVCSRSATNNRGYDVGKGLKCWQDEMKAYAAALGFKGPVTGYDLDKATPWAQNNTGSRDSAYVEYTRNGNACEIRIKPWSEMNSTSGACTNKANHKTVDMKTNKIVPITKNVTLTVTAKTGAAIRLLAAKDFDTFKV